MNTKKKILIAIGIVIAVAFVSGTSILAATTFGTTSDPLVTLSYLTAKFKPQLISEVNSSITAAESTLTATLDSKVSSFKADIDAKLSATDTEPVGFSLVTLSKGQTVTCYIGTELLLRLGTATAAGSAPALVDSTAGSTLTSGGALVANHMYLVTIQGNGLKATSSSVKVLIRGAYTVS